MQIESRKNVRNKNAKRLNLLKGRQPRNPSQTNGGAKIRINSEIAIPKLKKLAQDYIGVTDPQGFLTDLRIALGIPNSQGASKYGEVTIPKEDGSELKASLRITNHQANAEQYIKHNANYEYNLSIVVRRKERRNAFTPHEDVRLDEYVYYGKNIAQVENPLSQIVNGIIEFLQNGKYEDTTGVALKNTSPITTENKELNCNLNMNKKLIRLTESDLHRIVKESVKNVLREDFDSADSQQMLWLKSKQILKKYFGKNPNINIQDDDDTLYIEETNPMGGANGISIKWGYSSSDMIDMRESVHDYWEDAVYKYATREKLPKGWERIERENDEPIYRDPDYNEYVKDEYGKFKPIV